MVRCSNFIIWCWMIEKQYKTEWQTHSLLNSAIDAYRSNGVPARNTMTLCFCGENFIFRYWFKHRNIVISVKQRINVRPTKTIAVLFYLVERHGSCIARCVSCRWRLMVINHPTLERRERWRRSARWRAIIHVNVCSWPLPWGAPW